MLIYLENVEHIDYVYKVCKLILVYRIKIVQVVVGIKYVNDNLLAFLQNAYSSFTKWLDI